MPYANMGAGDLPNLRAAVSNLRGAVEDVFGREYDPAVIVCLTGSTMSGLNHWCRDSEEAAVSVSEFLMANARMGHVVVDVHVESREEYEDEASPLRRLAQFAPHARSESLPCIIVWDNERDFRKGYEGARIAIVGGHVEEGRE